MVKKAILKINFLLIASLGILLITANQEILFNNSFVFLRPILKNLFSNICHQDLTKVIVDGSATSYLCSRCEGIYIGAALTILVLRNNFKSFLYLLLTSSVLFGDVVLTTYGIYNYSKTFSFVTGLFWGSSVILYIRNGIFLLYKELKKNEK